MGKVNEHHGAPPVFPRLNHQLVKACTYRVAASASAAPTRAPSPSGPGLAQYVLRERLLDGGRERETAEIYERIVRADTARVGEIWLDGKSVSLHGRLGKLTSAISSDDDIARRAPLRDHILPQNSYSVTPHARRGA